jgi:hypothetical protein
MPKNKKICIVNFADGVFEKGQDRLKRSLNKIGFDGDTLFIKRLPESWPRHDEVPWGFKVYLLEEARKNGYESAIWIDAAGVAVRSIEPIISIMKKRGVFAFSRMSASVGEWSSNLALKALDLSREEAFRIPELSGFCIGVQFDHPKGKEFLDEWKKYADQKTAFLGVEAPYTIADSMSNKNGSLAEDPRVLGHRHDQTVASVIVHRLSVPLTDRYIFDIIGEAHDGKKYASYIPLDTIIVHDRDIKTDNFLAEITPEFGKNGAAKTVQIGRNFFYSILRCAKDMIKRHTIHKKKYGVRD